MIWATQPTTLHCNTQQEQDLLSHIKASSSYAKIKFYFKVAFLK